MQHVWLKAIILLLLASPIEIVAQEQDSEDVIDSILVCLERHDAVTIIEHMNDPIEIKIDEKKGIYSHSQAKILISNFFERHPFTSFTKNHTSQSGANEFSVIGTYKSKNSTFSLYFLLKKSGEVYRIYQFYIEKS